jgi:hypothetical protein
VHDFGSMPGQAPPLSYLRYGGVWRVGAWGTTAVRDARLKLRFLARRVFLVMGAPGTPEPLRVLLDGRPIPQSLSGADVRRGLVRVTSDRLYRIVELPDVQEHTLTIQAAPGVAVYDFTFG